jgi:heat shock protein 4
MMAAMKSPSFKVAEYVLEESNYYTIRVGWLINDTLDKIVAQKKQSMEIEQVSLTPYFPDK